MNDSTITELSPRDETIIFLRKLARRMQRVQWTGYASTMCGN